MFWLGCERRVIPADGLFRHDNMPKPFVDIDWSLQFTLPHAASQYQPRMKSTQEQFVGHPDNFQHELSPTEARTLSRYVFTASPKFHVAVSCASDAHTAVENHIRR